MALVVAFALSASASASELSPSPTEPVVADIVTSLLTHEHYSAQWMTEELATRWLDSYLDTLDPNRMFFLASDIAKFQSRTPELAATVIGEGASLSLALEVHGVYTQRVSKRMAAIRKLLRANHDLTLDESFTPDRTDAPWPADAAEATEFWRLRIKDALIIGELRERPRDEQIEMLRKRYDGMEERILAYESLDVLELWLTSLTKSFDPHSAYFKPATSDNFDIEISNSVEGIGAVLSTEDEYTVVQSVVAGGPAELDGQLGAGDKIVAVAQGKSPSTDIIDLRLDKVVALIRGKKGSMVTLTVVPAGETDHSQTVVIVLRRDKVVLQESDADAEIHDVKMAKGEPIRVGVIEIPSFYVGGKGSGGRTAGSAADTRRLLSELGTQGVDGVVIDLRENGGGGLGEAIEIAGLFVDSGQMVQVRDRSGEVFVLDDPDKKTVYDGPLIVLTSSLSASASEIVAAAVQDYDRGLVVGSDTTHGKGTVQSLYPLDRILDSLPGPGSKEARAGTLKLTTQMFYRISGGSTQNQGVLSDVVLPSPYDHLGFSESELDYALPWDEIPPARFTSANDVAHDLAGLRRKSKARVRDSEPFGQLQLLLDDRVDLQSQTTVSLNLEERKSQLAARTARLEAIEENTDENHQRNDIVLDETLAIMGDYIDTLR
jgi:carboxyl-terminal processing protease